jgi:hypothetical protein
MSENPYADRLFEESEARFNAVELAYQQSSPLGHRPMPVPGFEGLPRWLYAVCAHQCLTDGLGAV